MIRVPAASDFQILKLCRSASQHWILYSVHLPVQIWYFFPFAFLHALLNWQHLIFQNYELCCFVFLLWLLYSQQQIFKLSDLCRFGFVSWPHLPALPQTRTAQELSELCFWRLGSSTHVQVWPAQQQEGRNMITRNTLISALAIRAPALSISAEQLYSMHSSVDSNWFFKLLNYVVLLSWFHLSIQSTRYFNFQIYVVLLSCVDNIYQHCPKREPLRNLRNYVFGYSAVRHTYKYDQRNKKTEQTWWREAHRCQHLRYVDLLVAALSGPNAWSCFLWKRASRSSETHLQASSSSDFSQVSSVSEESAACLYTSCTFARSRTINVFSTTLAFSHTSTQSHWHSATLALSNINNQPHSHSATLAPILPEQFRFSRVGAAGCRAAK